MPTIAYEDLWPGRTFELGTVTVDGTEMLAFARRYDPQPFHLDADAARHSAMGALCASGWYTGALWMRSYVDTVLADSTSLGSPGGDELSWPAPVFPGDTLTSHLTVRTARMSNSRPGLGLVGMIGQLRRGDTTVFRMSFTGLFGPAH